MSIVGEAIQEAAKQVDRRINQDKAACRQALFDKYIVPNKNLVYWVCIQWTDDPENLEEDYTMALANLYKGIETYDSSRPIETWIHFITKRYVINLNKARYSERQKLDTDKNVYACCDEVTESDDPSWKTMTLENYRELYSDDVLEAIDSLKPIYKDALLLQQAGYSLVEIADIEYKKGTLDSRNINTVKNRLFMARQYMKNKLTRDGKRKTD